MNTIGNDELLRQLEDFSSVGDALWKVSDIGAVKHEVVDDGSCYREELSLWDDVPGGNDDDAFPSTSSSFMPLKAASGGKRSFTDILREVKVRESTLECAVARLGGGIQGLQVLMERVNSWANSSESADEDVTVATIRQGIVDLGMPPPPKRHQLLHGLGVKSETPRDYACSLDPPWPQMSPHVAYESVNHDAAYTRALRKSHMVRQRGQTKVQRPQTMSRCRNQWRGSSGHVDFNEPKLCTENGKAYEFLFQKELRASDVSSLGRIVLPKKDAERHLPFLMMREGMMISLEDYHCSGRFWTARYRFWPNNKSRMYLLENIGDFVSFHHLQEGDLLLCYRNEGGGFVIRGQKAATNGKIPAKGPTNSKEASQLKENTTETLANTTALMPSTTRQIVGGESEQPFASYSKSFQVTNCRGEEVNEGNYSSQDGHSSCLSQQMGFPSFYKPPVQDWGFDPMIAMLSVNVKERYMDANQFSEVYQ